MRIFLAIVLFAAITGQAQARVGETYDDVKSRINPSAIFADADLGKGYTRIIWRGDAGIYRNVTFRDGVVYFEQFSKYDRTDLSEEDIDRLLHEEASPGTWKPEPSAKDRTFINTETNVVAKLFSLQASGRTTYFLDISQGPQPTPTPAPKPVASGHPAPKFSSFAYNLGLMLVVAGVVIFALSVQAFRARKSFLGTCISIAGFSTCLLFLFYGFFILVMG